MKLLNGDCLEKMKDISDNSVDIIIADLPYGRFKHLEWDKALDLKKLWLEIWRVSKKNTPVFLFGDMKFGVELINSQPKHFKYEIVWNKGKTTTPLLSRKRLGKSTEYVFIFYKNQPVYNYAKYHKVCEKRDEKNATKDNAIMSHYKHSKHNVYDPRLPLNIIKQELTSWGTKSKIKRSLKMYEPRLPINVVKEPKQPIHREGYKSSLIIGGEPLLNLDNRYEPTLPLNIIECKKICRNKLIKNITEKPQFLLEFILKYFSNEGDVCLDMTMGSGSCGVACNNLERKFIGIEINKAHFEVAKKRLSAIN